MGRILCRPAFVMVDLLGHAAASDILDVVDEPSRSLRHQSCVTHGLIAIVFTTNKAIVDMGRTTTSHTRGIAVRNRVSSLTRHGGGVACTGAVTGITEISGSNTTRFGPVLDQRDTSSTVVWRQGFALDAKQRYWETVFWETFFRARHASDQVLGSAFLGTS